MRGAQGAGVPQSEATRRIMRGALGAVIPARVGNEL